MIDQILWNNEVLALIIRNAFSADGVNFITPEAASMQVGILQHPKGKIIKPHQHNKCLRSIIETHEVLHIISGKLEVQFYIDAIQVSTQVLLKGDTVILMKGGHGFTILEDSKILEVKQGPYGGVENDKKIF